MKPPRTSLLLFSFICALTGWSGSSKAAVPVHPPAPLSLEQSQEKALERSLENFVRQRVRTHTQNWGDEYPHLAPDIRIDRHHLRRSLRGKPPCLEPDFFLPETTLRPQLTIILRCQHGVSKPALKPETHNASNKPAKPAKPVFWTGYVPVKLRLPGTYPVAARPLPPNHTISAADVRLRSGDLLRLTPDTIIDLQNVLQHTTTQRIAARQPFKHNTLRHPHTVQRGQTLTLQIRGAHYTISTTGTALQAGGIGSQIHARNAAGLTVQGRLIDAHTLVLTP